MEELDIDREFADLCPALTTEEYALLEQSIIDDGCRDPLVLWKGLILDGHNRYEICHKHGKTFKHKTLNLPSREAALAWILRNQCGRRNLTESQRAFLAAKLATLTRGDNQHTKEDAHQCATSQTEAAEDFGVSRRTVQHAAKVIEEGSAALQKAVQSGEVPVKPAAVVATLPKAEQRKVVAKGPKAVKEKAKEITEANKVKHYNDPFDPAKLGKELAKDKKPGTAKVTFKDKDVDEAFGKVARLLDQRWNELAGHRGKYTATMNSLKDAMAKWAEWRDWKGAIA